MPTTYKDQFYTIDPGVPPAGGTAVTFQRSSFVDNDDDGLIRPNTGDTFEGNLITSVWQGDTLTIQVPGVGNITYTGVTYYIQGQPAVFTPTDGQVLQDGTFVSSTFVTNSTQTPVGNFGPTCFTPSTWIETATGPRLIETLAVGDWVTTLDDGSQQIRAIARQTAKAIGVFAPVRFEAGAIGNDTPLVISQQHRVLISDWRAEFFFGLEEVLVAAKHLVNGTSIRLTEGGMVEYIHLVFDSHHIIFAQGVPSESYYPAHAAGKGDAALRAEMKTLYPDLTEQPDVTWPMVRPVIRQNEAQMLAA